MQLTKTQLMYSFRGRMQMAAEAAAAEEAVKNKLVTQRPMVRANKSAEGAR